MRPNPAMPEKGVRMMRLEKYSMGIGDRFGKEGDAQLAAFEKARRQGVVVAPVWNKSYREHMIVHTLPGDVRMEAEFAVTAASWTDSYYVDADHISLKNVDLFLGASDFFTLDVADFIGKSGDAAQVDAFVARHKDLAGRLEVPGVKAPLVVTPEGMREAAEKYLHAVQEAGRIYQRIREACGEGNFVTEVSMDETMASQTPQELFFILAAVADAGIPAQTIAPKFTGRFNKGVDYQGDVMRFAREFEDDLAVIAYAVKRFDLPKNLKLSVHSGSDKFSLYAPIRAALKKFNAGLHLKTAGTTWLEEVIGLAECGGAGLAVANAIYAEAYQRFDELCKPYASVIDIRRERLPPPSVVAAWAPEEFTAAIRHDEGCVRYDPNMRQLLHVGYKVAAEMGPRYFDALHDCRTVVSRNVTHNIYERHLKPVFIDR
jgi:hypothetical protein